MRDEIVARELGQDRPVPVTDDGQNVPTTRNFHGVGQPRDERFDAGLRENVPDDEIYPEIYRPAYARNEH